MTFAVHYFRSCWEDFSHKNSNTLIKALNQIKRLGAHKKRQLYKIENKAFLIGIVLFLQPTFHQSFVTCGLNNSSTFVLIIGV
jgi:hypothetical protein